MGYSGAEGGRYSGVMTSAMNWLAFSEELPDLEQYLKLFYNLLPVGNTQAGHLHFPDHLSAFLPKFSFSLLGGLERPGKSYPRRRRISAAILVLLGITKSSIFVANGIGVSKTASRTGGESR